MGPASVLVAIGVGAALVALSAAALAAGTREVHASTVLWLVLACWAVFAVGCQPVRRLPSRVGVPLVLIVGVALQVVAVAWPPRTSDDVYRYAWDGHVANAGIDPYAYPPSAHALDGVRLGWLFPAGHPALVNRPTVPTIYPPVAQLWFRLIVAVTPDSWHIRPYQSAAALVALGGAVLLMLVLRHSGRSPVGAVAWAWCPLVVFESGNGGHVDGLAAVLTLAALWLAACRRAGWGGVLLGLAVGVKGLPGLVAPAVLRRRPAALLGGATAVLVGAYLPHLAAVGRSAIGFLPTYLGQEGYQNGDRFGLLSLVVPTRWATVLALVVVAVAALLVLLKSDPGRPWVGAATMSGVALLVVTPTYPWYAVGLVALAVAAERLEWLAVAAGGYVPYLAGWTHWGNQPLQVIGYGSAAVVVVVVNVIRVVGRAPIPTGTSVLPTGSVAQPPDGRVATD